MYYVYILRCADQSLYVGYTRNIERRVEAHNAGRGAAFTNRPTEDWGKFLGDAPAATATSIASWRTQRSSR